MAEKKERFSNTPHQRKSRDDAPYAADVRERSMVSVCRLEACAEADAYAKKKDVHWSTPHLERNLARKCHIAVSPSSHGSISHTPSREGGVAALCQEEALPCHLEEQVPAREATEAVSESSLTSKLSSLCFLEERGPQVPQYLIDFQWASFSSLLRPLVMDEIRQSSTIPNVLEQSCLQINLDRNRDLLHLQQYKGSVCIDHVSINWSILREWLQVFYGSCVPGLNHGKNFQNLEWGYAKTPTSQALKHGSHISSSHSTKEHAKLCTAAQRSLLDLSDLSVFRGTSSNTYVEDGGSGADRTEDIGTACCSSIKSDDECEGVYCLGTEFSPDEYGGLDYPDILCGAQCHRDDDFCCCKFCIGVDGIDIFRVEDTENNYGRFDHPAMDKDVSFNDCSAHCSEYIGPLCGGDIDDICKTDYYANESGDTIFGGNFNVSDAVYGDVPSAYENRLYGSPVEIYPVKWHTWWDEDAVLLDKKETEKEKIEDEWQVV